MRSSQRCLRQVCRRPSGGFDHALLSASQALDVRAADELRHAGIDFKASLANRKGLIESVEKHKDRISEYSLWVWDGFKRIKVAESVSACGTLEIKHPGLFAGQVNRDPQWISVEIEQARDTRVDQAFIDGFVAGARFFDCRGVSSSTGCLSHQNPG